jgi:hypothetical protein
MVVNTTAETNPKGVSPEMEMCDYWARRGSKTAAFMLVIPGCGIVGLGIGLIVNQMLAASVIGLGVGMVLWGLVVALTD